MTPVATAIPMPPRRSPRRLPGAGEWDWITPIGLSSLRVRRAVLEITGYDPRNRASRNTVLPARMAMVFQAFPTRVGNAPPD